MRLENILNDVSIAHNLTPRSRSLCSSPIQCEFDADVSLQYLLPKTLLTSPVQTTKGLQQHVDRFDEERLSHRQIRQEEEGKDAQVFGMSEGIPKVKII